MKFRTEIDSSRKGTIAHGDRILMLGSCFTESIGQRMLRNKLNVDINRFLSERRRLSSDDLVKTGNLWSSWLHHGCFSSVSKSETLTRINERLDQTESQTPDWLFITLGTAWVYELVANGQVVANCHKMPDRLFRRRLMSVVEGVNALRHAFKCFRDAYPGVSIVLTVSPVRHLRDGLHGNQVSKAALMMLCNEFETEGEADYFPSYELLIDDLRDYRFYADDLVHPSLSAQNYVWEKWCEAFLSEQTRQIGQEAEKLLRGMSHRPLSDDHGAYRSFCHTLSQKMEAFQALHPSVDFRDECRQLHEIINTTT